jgi:cyclopropane-fatty-acyl-phospholipid synthase
MRATTTPWKRHRPASWTASAASCGWGRTTTWSKSAPAGAVSPCTPRRTTGCRVTTTTISREQHALASQRVAEAGLRRPHHPAAVGLPRPAGPYDKLVSIEMIEAIGAQYLDTYFAQCGRLLGRDGLALVQAITIEDHRYEQALRSVDFIKRHIFPGSFIPSIKRDAGAKTRSSDLSAGQPGGLRAPAMRAPCTHWRERFLARSSSVRAQGYRRALHAHVGVLPGLLRRRLPRTLDRRRPPVLMAKPGYRGGSYLPGLLEA